ncbi:hypothetical protein PMAYCL1PPCAC_15146, partial [Pristionchus mayeri]
TLAMLPTVFIIFFFTGTVVCQQSSHINGAIPNVNVSILLRAVGIPYCMKPCIGRFAYDIKKLFSFNNVAENFGELCNEYVTSKECLDKRSCRLRNVF